MADTVSCFLDAFSALADHEAKDSAAQRGALWSARERIMKRDGVVFMVISIGRITGPPRPRQYRGETFSLPSARQFVNILLYANLRDRPDPQTRTLRPRS